jgi:hypothetical protein
MAANILTLLVWWWMLSFDAKMFGLFNLQHKHLHCKWKRLNDYRHRSFQLELIFFAHKQRKPFYVLDDGDIFLFVSIGQAFKTLLNVARFLQEQFLVHLLVLNELIALSFFLLRVRVW